MEHNMKKFSAVIALCGVLAVPAFAASESVDAAVKTFKSVGDDADKLKIYCEMSKIMSMDEDVEDEYGGGGRFDDPAPRQRSSLRGS